MNPSDKAKSLLETIDDYSSKNCVLTNTGVLQLETISMLYYMGPIKKFWNGRLKMNANSGITSKRKTKLEWWTAPILCGAIKNARSLNVTQLKHDRELCDDLGLQIIYWQLYYNLQREYKSTELLDIIDTYNQSGQKLTAKLVSTWVENQSKPWSVVKHGVLSNCSNSEIVNQAKPKRYIPIWQAPAVVAQ